MCCSLLSINLVRSANERSKVSELFRVSKNFPVHRRCLGKNRASLDKIVALEFFSLPSIHLADFTEQIASYRYTSCIYIYIHFDERGEGLGFLFKIERSGGAKPTENLISPRRVIPLSRVSLSQARFSFANFPRNETGNWSKEFKSSR